MYIELVKKHNTKTQTQLRLMSKQIAFLSEQQAQNDIYEF